MIISSKRLDKAVELFKQAVEEKKLIDEEKEKLIRRIHYINYHAVGVVQRIFDGKDIITYKEYCKLYPLNEMEKARILKHINEEVKE